MNAGDSDTQTPDIFRQQLPAGFALAAMNFAVHPDGEGKSIVTTETRVFANSAATRRRFAIYWRVIYPGSAIIRRMWLRAIQRRALAAQTGSGTTEDSAAGPRDSNAAVLRSGSGERE